MGSVKFTRKPNAGRQIRYEAKHEPTSKGMKRYPQRSAASQLEPTEGIPGFYPTGTDTKTPGYPKERKRTSTRGYVQR